MPLHPFVQIAAFAALLPASLGYAGARARGSQPALRYQFHVPGHPRVMVVRHPEAAAVGHFVMKNSLARAAFNTALRRLWTQNPRARRGAVGVDLAEANRGLGALFIVGPPDLRDAETGGPMVLGPAVSPAAVAHVPDIADVPGLADRLKPLPQQLGEALLAAAAASRAHRDAR